MRPASLAGLLLVAGCAGYSGSTLEPGRSTGEDVVATMGAPALERAAPDGERVLWYPRQPFGRESFAVRLGSDGRLVSVEQALTARRVARLRQNASTAEDVLDLLGPPYRVHHYPRMQREAWEYPLRTPPADRTLYVQLSPDRVVREVYLLLDALDEEFPFLVR